MKTAFLLFLFLAVWILIIPALLKWLWNMTIPELFGLKELRYWQAFRLLIIASLLTGGGSLINFTSDNKNSKQFISSKPFAQNKDSNLISLPFENNSTEIK